MNFASNLTGKTIHGWVVEEKNQKSDGTGGCFSSGYRVRHEDTKRRAFLKAFNLEYAFSGGSLIDHLNQMTSDFKHERDLAQKCNGHNFDHVVIILDHGEYLDPAATSKTDTVPYLVFEMAEHDIRRHPKIQKLNLAWRLRVFHGTCVGLMQLHSIGSKHQDLKPSNVLVFEGDISKIGDLGRATSDISNHNSGPGYHGDPGYKPIEYYYEEDWNGNKCSSDLYMLGSFLTFLFADVQFFGSMLLKLPPAYHPLNWTGSLDAAIPALRSASTAAISEIVAKVPDSIKEDAKNLLLWLCDPDPKVRGNPEAAAERNPHSLSRIVTIADRMANRMALESK